MAIATRATTTLANASRTNSTVNKPAGTASGDVMYCHLSVANATFASPVAVTPPAGWTLINAGTLFTGNAAPDNFILKLYVYRRVAGGAEGASYQWTHSAAGTEAFLESWQGVDNVTPEDLAVNENSSINQGLNQGKTVTIPSLTSVTNGAQLVSCDTNWDAAGAGSYSGTTPTLTTELTGSALKVATGNLATAGASGSRTRANGNGSTDSAVGWVSVTYFIRPSTGAAAASMLPLNPMQQMLNQLLAR